MTGSLAIVLIGAVVTLTKLATSFGHRLDTNDRLHERHQEDLKENKREVTALHGRVSVLESEHRDGFRRGHRSDVYPTLGSRDQ